MNILLDPATFLELAKKHGLSRNQAIELSEISSRTWCYWEYQKRFNPSFNSLQKLTTIANGLGWL